MQFPKNPKDAAAAVKQAAKRARLTVSAYCLRRGVSPAVLYNWETRNKQYDVSVFERLMQEHQRLEDKQITGSLRK